ncbi:ABC transporter substrate-binding protein, partial [uncultured Hyphomicrobium sp.]|uniref:ABC transporter substrate-binding protein n=1 Tax=uncultured Hyphomicrobium sp. TaxID=194373 RepID=UPI0025FF5511
MHGAPALAEGFAAFPYVNPDAPKGGRVTLGSSGSFDNLNPMIVRGEPVQGIREFVVESLMARSQDEPFTLYGLIAEKIDVAETRGEVTFHLNPLAKFSDGQPVTTADVQFSFEALRDKGRPNYRTYYKKVAKTEVLSDRVIRFVFADASDRELPLILGLMPILPRHAMSADTFDQTTLSPIVGSGPYRICL